MSTTLPTTTFSAGDVVLVRFPFTDLSAAKKRPAVVLSPSSFPSRYSDLTVLAMTSQPQAEDWTLVESWRQAGLPKPTWLKPLLGTISSSVVLRTLGQLPAGECSRIDKVLRLMIADQFLVKTESHSPPR